MMIQTLEKLSNIHFEHLIWINELQHIREEVKIYLARIELLASQFADLKLNGELKDFKDEFNRILEQITEWQVTIGTHVFHIQELASLDGALTHMSNSQHEDIRDKMNFLRRSMITLKESFQYFLIHRIR
ncbi:MAG: hypothetical protein HKN76_01185 [Saprospiraceae bacterium]|nr:hypothetical protein [Saprospiraceae bacterium]